MTLIGSVSTVVGWSPFCSSVLKLALSLLRWDSGEMKAFTPRGPRQESKKGDLLTKRN
jgi:hypothetical protein